MGLAAVVLDVNETLFSLAAIGDAFDEVGLTADDLPLWFARVLRDGFAATAAGDPVAFPELARHHTRVLLDAASGAAGDDAVERVVAAFGEVEAHPDVTAGLRALRDAGIRLVAFTNGSAAVVEGFLARSGLDDVVEEALDVTAAGAWKPHPAAYRWVCDHLDVDPGDAAMLAVHPWDVAGAMRVGMLGAWVDRDHARWPSWLTRPTVSAQSLTELAHTLTAR